MSLGALVAFFFFLFFYHVDTRSLLATLFDGRQDKTFEKYSSGLIFLSVLPVHESGARASCFFYILFIKLIINFFLKICKGLINRYFILPMFVFVSTPQILIQTLTMILNTKNTVNAKSRGGANIFTSGIRSRFVFDGNRIAQNFHL
jgi:hypothetical protein